MLASVLLASDAHAATGAATSVPAILGLDVADIVRTIFETLFGDIQAQAGRALVSYLLVIPNLTGGRLTGLQQTTNAIAFGLMGVVMTFAVMRYWMVGLSSSGSGGSEAIEGITRTIAAALMIVAWPYLFRQGVALSNSASDALMGDARTQSDMSTLIRSVLVLTFATAPLGLAVSSIMCLGGVLLLLALLAMKVVISASMAVLFVAMPIAIILWPVSEASWLLRFAGRAMFVCLAIPIVWAIIFRTFLAVGADALTFRGGGGLLDVGVLRPLTALALMFVAVTVPKQLMRAAMMGASAPGSGMGGKIATGVGVRSATKGIEAALPAAKAAAAAKAAGALPPPQTTMSVGDKGALRTSTALKGVDLNNPAHRQIAESFTAWAAGQAEGNSSANGAAPEPASAPDTSVSAPARETGGAPDDHATPAVNAPHDHGRYEHEKKVIAALVAQGQPDAKAAQDAFAALSPAQRANVSAAHADPKTNTAAFLMNEAAANWNHPHQRVGLRTLAAASPQARDQAITGAAPEPPSTPVAHSASAPSTTGASGAPSAPEPSPHAAPGSNGPVGAPPPPGAPAQPSSRAAPGAPAARPAPTPPADKAPPMAPPPVSPDNPNPML